MGGDQRRTKSDSSHSHSAQRLRDTDQPDQQLQQSNFEEQIDFQEGPFVSERNGLQHIGISPGSPNLEKTAEFFKGIRETTEVDTDKDQTNAKFS